MKEKLKQYKNVAFVSTEKHTLNAIFKVNADASRAYNHVVYDCTDKQGRFALELFSLATMLELEKSGSVTRRRVVDKQPVGVHPKWISDMHRLNDIRVAIQRYFNDGLVIDIEWVEEYNVLTEELKDYEHFNFDKI